MRIQLSKMRALNLKITGSRSHILIPRRNFSKMCKLNIKTFVFFDSETTGLPHLESYKTRITELCMTIVKSEHLSLGVMPRVQNKLNLCFNPCKLISMEASNMTGLTNELLEYQSPFCKGTVDVINNFLNLQEKPVCFVAHNGNAFDYPILKYEINRSGGELPEDVLCIDSLQAFRELYKDLLAETNQNKSDRAEANPQPVSQIPFEFDDEFDAFLCSVVDEVERKLETKTVDSTDSSSSFLKKKSVEEIQKINETTPKKQIIKSTNESFRAGSSRRQLNFPKMSFKLVDVFMRLTGKQPANAHRTEGDVDMLIECAATLGQDFINWANNNVRKFSDIPMMQPGRRLGL